MTDHSKTTLSTPVAQDPAADTPQGETEPKQDTENGKRNSGLDVHAYIGRQLRAVYDDVAKQPVPERFLDLMKQLENTKS